MAAKLIAEEGIQKGLILSLDEGTEWVIGRDPDACQLLIEDPSTSRKHLLCRKTSDGIFLQNLSSTNPIAINDEEVHEPRLLHHGDLVKIGAGLYRFYAEDKAQIVDKDEISHNPNEHLESDTHNHHEQIEPNGVEPNGNEILSLPQEALEVHSEMENERLKENNEEKSKQQQDDSKENQMTQTDATDEDLEKDIESFQNNIIEADAAEEVPSPSSHEEDNLNELVDEPTNPHESMNTLPEQEIESSQSEHLFSPDESKNETAHEVSSDHELSSDIEPKANLELSTEFDSDPISIFDEPADQSSFPEINFDLTETGRWLLKVIGGPNHGAEFIMQQSSTYLIGTDPNSCDIVFHDTSVSRQHAKITISEDDTILLEDLKSRNGTLVDGKPLIGKQTISANTVVMMGTSSFVVYDRESEMHTIISPLLPSIVKVLQEETKQEQPLSPQIPETALEESQKSSEPLASVEPSKKKEHMHDALGAFILIAIITGLFVIIGIGTTTLFKSQPFVTEQIIHPDRDLTQALASFPNVKYSFNRSTGRLLLVGHVLNGSDKNQILYNLQGLKYVRGIDDSGVIIDEGVWREINQILSQNPNWKGISIHSPLPGHFVISGYLKTRKQADQLADYISNNFPYLDLLEKRVIVEEDVVSAISSNLQNHGLKDISIQMNEGVVTLTGGIPAGKTADLEKATAAIKDIPGVRGMKNLVTEMAPEQSMINISDKYEITGVSHQGPINTSVIINGRILTRGDVLDGMTITSIKPSAVFLEKDGIRYRIDYSK